MEVGVWGRIDTCECMAEFLPCSSETITVLLIGYSESESRSVVSNSLWPHGLYSPWSSPGQNAGVGSLSLFQGIFPTQGSKPGLLNCRRIVCRLSHNHSIVNWLCCCRRQVTSVMSSSVDGSPPGSSVHEILWARVGCHFLLRLIDYIPIQNKKFKVWKKKQYCTAYVKAAKRVDLTGSHHEKKISVT